jgi:hypothetical protein
MDMTMRSPTSEADAAFDDALARALERASASFDPTAEWAARVRASLYELLEFIDERPELAQACIAQVLASPETLNGRGETLGRITTIIDEGRTATRASRQPPPLTARGVIGGVLGLIYARLIARDPRPMVDLLNPSMSIIVLPYLGNAAAERELSRPSPKPRSSPRQQVLDRGVGGLGLRLTYRTLAVLEAIAAEPGLSNNEIAERAGIADPGQISKLLKRVAGHGLAENIGAGQPQGEPNAWRLTPKGEQVRRTAAPRR